VKAILSWMLCAACLFALGLLPARSGEKKDKPKRIVATNAKDAGPDYPFQGEYVGEDSNGTKVAAQVVARGGGQFFIVGYKDGLPGDGWDGQSKIEGTGKLVDGKVEIELKSYKGEIANGEMTASDGNTTAKLKKVTRKNPTEGMKPPAGAVVLFDGRNADEWNGGKLVEGDLLNHGVTSKKSFKDFTLHLEFRLPFMPSDRGQGRANSGLYLQNRYELQILDSFGLAGKVDECGCFYRQVDPLVNMCLPPLAWQTYDIDFTAARFGPDGKRVSPAKVTVKHNGVVIHDNAEIPGSSGGGQKESDAPGPFQLQNHGDPVHFRNIWVVEKK
jgi:hypothetical protein